MDVKVLKELKNKRGEIKTKIVRVTNKIPSKAIDFDSINELYKELLQKYKAENISITAKPLDGNFTTLKSSSYNGDNLKHADES